MELEPREGGRMHFKLGPIELWVVGIIAFAFIGGCGKFVNSINSKMDEMVKVQQQLTTQQAVTNQQILTLSAQLSDVPALSQRVSKLEVQMEQQTAETAELRRLRGLK